MIILILLLGLAVGSFVGAYSYRAPRGLSVGRGRSICPGCKAQIAWYDNLPLFSYLILKARCRNCKKFISPRYFLLESAGLIAFVGIYLGFPLLTQSMVWLAGLPYLLGLMYVLFLAAALMAIFAIDWEHGLILDESVFWPYLITIDFLILFAPENFYAHLLAGLGCGLFLLAINLLTHGRGMGLGDVKLSLFLGTAAGIWSSFVYMFWAFIIGALVGIILIVLNKKQMTSQIAFGPFLILGFVVSMFTAPYFARLFFIF